VLRSIQTRVNGPMESGTSAIARDHRDLRRGVAINALGYVIKLMPWLLLLLVTHRYGIELFGAFMIAQATMMLAARVAAVGLDKAMLWWVPRLPVAERRHGLRSALAVTLAAATVTTAVLILLARPDALEWLGQPVAIASPLRIVALALLPRVWTDVFTHAVIGQRRMEAQVLVSEGLVPVSFPLFALALHVAGATVSGLAIAWVLAHALGLWVAFLAFRRAFVQATARVPESHRPPAELLAYAAPMWIGEVANSFTQRLDTFLIEALTHDLALVGAWGVVTSVSNSIRAIRRSFDPIVIAIIAEVGHAGDLRRVHAGFSYATFLVLCTQMPVFAFVFAFAGDITPLFGPGFERATTPIVILAFAWQVNGLFGLAGAVVSAYGLAGRTLFGQALVIVVLALAGLVLIPAYGLVGAAWAVALAYTTQGLVQLVQMRLAIGAFPYDHRIWTVFAVGIASLALMGLVGWAWPGPAFAGRVAAFSAFALGYGAAVWVMARAGWLVRRGC
jgi:O-antigen/teichoic acid export membrane protein